MSFSPKKVQRKSRDELNAEGRARKKQKKHRGHTAGSRAGDANSANSSQNNRQANNDPRLGSKKPVELIATPVVVKTKVKPKKEKVKLTPQQELTQLENDERLDALLERLEEGGELSPQEQSYVDNTLDRIDELMDMLGIEIDESDDDSDIPEPKEDIIHLLKRS